MKKKFFTGMAVLLLGASLFFFGCGGDDEPELPPAKSAEESLKDDLGGKAAVDGTTVTLTDNVELTKEVTVPEGVTLSVPKDKTLTVGAGGSLTVTGVLVGAVDATNANVAAKVVVTAAETVTGAGANVFYPATGTTSMAAVAVGTYIWDAAAGGSGVAGWKQLQVVTTYSLKENIGGTTNVDSGVSIASVLKNTSTGSVTIKLAGQFKAEYLYYGDGKLATAAKAGTKWDRGTWGPADCKPLTGAYGAVYIKGFADAALSNVAVKAVNPALVIYTDVTSLAVSNTDLQAPKEYGTYPDMHIAGDASQRWVLYSALPQDDIFGIMLYGGAAAGNQKVTLDFDQWSATSAGGKVTTGADGGDILDVVIDYSGVDFTATGTETDVKTTYSLRVSTEANAAEVVAADGFGVSIVSAKKNAATNTVTFKLGGTFGGKWIYAADGQASSDASTLAGSKWNTGGLGSCRLHSCTGQVWGSVYPGLRRCQRLAKCCRRGYKSGACCLH
jgi:hypothetical protein